MRCDDCGQAEATSVFDGFGAFCAACAAGRACRPGGLPALPPPPDPVTITGPDGTPHRLVFRAWRCHNGVVVDLEEPGVAGGFSFSTISTIGRHDQPIGAQVAHLLAAAHTAIGAAAQLEAPRPGAPQLLAGTAVTGRLVWPGGTDAERYPYDVVVDGRLLSWDEFGLTLEAFEGFRFRLVLEEDCDEVPDTRQDPAAPVGR